MRKEEKRVLAELCFNNAHQAHQSEQYPAAEHWYKNTLVFDSRNLDIHYSLAFPYALQRKWKEAEEQLNIASKSKTKKESALYCRGLVRLMQNDYVGGFIDLEHRLEMSQLKHINDRFKHRAVWEGQDCETLYIYGEQGFGDVIMFSRYLPLIKNVKKIYFEVPKACYSLFKFNFRHYPHINVVSDYSTVDSLGTNKAFTDSDYYCHIMSLVRIMGTTFDTVPPIQLDASPEDINKFKDISSVKAVAVCYGGRPIAGDPMVKEWNIRRNVDANWINPILGKYFTHIIPIEKDLNPGIETWSDTAGIIANCALVVSIDSGPVHLAGAMGVPTVLLNHYQTCWRWTLDQDHTPWYSNELTILRQPKEKDWQLVLIELGTYLEKRYNKVDEVNTTTAGVS